MILGAAIVAALVLGVYFKTLDFPFVNYGDGVNVYANPAVTVGLSWAALRDAASPMASLSHRLVVLVAGGGPRSAHAANILLQLANTLLLFLLLVRLTGAVWRSTTVAALFAMHPLQVETVAWISARGELLAGLFCLLSLWFHVRGRVSGVYVFAVLAMLSSPISAALPILLMATNGWPVARPFDRAYLPLFLLPVVTLGRVLASGSGEARLGPAVYGAYLSRLVWPASLSISYPVPSSVYSAVAAVVLVGACLYLTFRYRGAAPYLFAGLMWFAAGLLPACLMTVTRGAADSWCYLALPGIFLAAVWGLKEVLGTTPLARVVLIVVVSLWLVLSWTQADQWRDSVVLYRKALVLAPANEEILGRLAATYIEQNRTQEAIAFHSLQVQRSVDPYVDQYLLGALYARQNQYTLAIDQFREVLRQRPEMTIARHGLASVLMSAERSEEALKVDPDVLRYWPEQGKPLPAPPTSVPAPSTFLTSEEWVQFGAVSVVFLLAFTVPSNLIRRVARLERTFARFARNRTRALIVAGLLPLAIRLALLPVYPIPEPQVADEFGHLLIADTFADGRLTNPPHPMGRHFESIYVLLEPSYTSIYPVAQGAVMALPQLAGWSPWFGVWLSVGLMCLTITWMLQAWLPPRWALLGGLIAVLRFSIFGHWMNSYWGGAMAACGGALALGAVRRIPHTQRPRDVFWLALGVLILSQTRPYEGLILGVATTAALAWWFFRTHLPLAQRLRKVIIPLACFMGVGVAASLYYNYRVTGDFRQLPYKLYQGQHGVPQTFFWQAPIQPAPGVHWQKDIRDNFEWQLSQHEKRNSLASLWMLSVEKTLSFWRFYIQPSFTLPLLFLPWVIRDRRFRFLLLALAAMIGAMAMYPFFFPHYAAPATALLLAYLIQSLRHLRAFHFQGRPLGVFIGGGLLAVAVLGAVYPASADFNGPILFHVRNERSEIVRELESRPGTHLVMVRYAPDHVFHFSWIYNHADIDASRIVWARELDDSTNEELFRYYKGRAIWLLEPDQTPPRLTPYPISGTP